MSELFTSRAKPDEIDREAWEGLAAGIILQAVKDYRTVLLRKKQDPKKAIITRAPLERFFRSNWFHALSGGVDSEWLIAKLRAELDAKENRNDRKRLPPATHGPAQPHRTAVQPGG